MPGISICRDEGGAPRETFERAVAPTVHDERYSSQVAYESGSVVVGYTSYPSYPVQEIERDRYLFVLEGHVYDWEQGQVSDRLDALADATDGFADREKLESWVASIDGEFLLCVVDRGSEDLTVVTDCLGRLPAYHGSREGRTVLSRQHRTVVEALSSSSSGSKSKPGSESASGSGATPTFDRLAVGQYLLFGYTLGRRTLIDGIETLPPAARVSMADDGARVTRLSTFDFDAKAHRDRSLEANVTELVERFVAACRTRAERSGERNLISLSGGLDSRAILAAFVENDLSCTAATMNHDAVAGSDVSIAGGLASEYGIDWRCYDLPEADEEVFRTHLRTGDARDPLAIAHIHGFFERLIAEHGAMTYFAGDGGDKALPDVTPTRRIEDIDALVAYVIEANRRFTLADAAEISGVAESAISRSIRDRLASYPETSSDGKYVHFLVHERARNWLFEAEDTNRRYAWSPSPFYSLPFFRYAMNCPDEQKRHYRLYSSFLSELSPTAAGVPNANFGVAPDSPLHTAAAVAYDTIGRYPELFDRLKPLLARAVGFDSVETDGTDSIPERYTRARLDDGRRIDGAVSGPALEAWFDDDRSDGARFEAYLLATITTYADELTGDGGRSEGSREAERSHPIGSDVFAE